MGTVSMDSAGDDASPPPGDGTACATLLCEASGDVVFATPDAVSMLARTGIVAQAGQPLLPLAVWRELVAGPVGEPRDWSTGTALLAVRRYPAEEGRTILTFQEIFSGRKNLVERLHQQRTEAISALVANIAHDVRNPLSAMLFNLESLSQCACEAPDIRESIQGIRDATGTLCRIVDGLVDFAALSPSREGIPIGRVLDRLKSLLRGVLRAGNHTLEVTVEPAVYCVRIHPLMLEQVLASLVMNALDANPAGTAVYLRAAPYRQPNNADRHFVRIEVENRGAPIPSWVETRLFEPFFSTKPEGMGLGLATAREALRSAGGDVWFVPTTGGVRFDVIVPAGQADRTEMEAGR